MRPCVPSACFTSCSQHMVAVIVAVAVVIILENLRTELPTQVHFKRGKRLGGEVGLEHQGV